jgi:hypothetical protein
LTIDILGILETEFAVTVINEVVVTGVCAVDKVEKRIAGEQAVPVILTARAALPHNFPAQILLASAREIILAYYLAAARCRIFLLFARIRFARVNRAYSEV